eukprot:Nk52_evm7s2309 gene=Nk52_evmTU7s2309
MNKNCYIAIGTLAVASLTMAYFTWSYKNSYDSLLAKYESEKCFCNANEEKSSEPISIKLEEEVTTEEGTSSEE